MDVTTAENYATRLSTLGDDELRREDDALLRQAWDTTLAPIDRTLAGEKRMFVNARRLALQGVDPRASIDAPKPQDPETMSVTEKEARAAVEAGVPHPSFTREINLRALKVEHEAKLSYSVDTIKVLEQSNAQKALSITELEAKLTAAY